MARITHLICRATLWKTLSVPSRPPRFCIIKISQVDGSVPFLQKVLIPYVVDLPLEFQSGLFLLFLFHGV